MMKALASAVFLVSATAFSSPDNSGKADPTATGATSAVGLSSATKDAAKQYLEKFIVDNNIPGVLIQVITPAGSWSEALGKANKSPSMVVAMNSDKKVNGEQGVNVLLRDISKILFPDNPVNVPVIK